MFDDEKDWSPLRARNGQLHIIPNNDLREHDLTWRCDCTPAFSPVCNDWGDEWAWILEHSAYDLREEFAELDERMG